MDSLSAQIVLFLAVTIFSTLYSGLFDVILLIGFSLARQIHLLAEHDSSRLLGTVLAGAQGLIVAFVVFQLLRYLWLSSAASPRWRGPGRVLFFPSRTSHTRTFPKIHSFAYSYLVIGVPVGWEGNANGMVSAGAKSDTGLWSWFSWDRSARKGWYDIDAANHLQRGSGHLGLRGKLDAYLESQVSPIAMIVHSRPSSMLTQSISQGQDPAKYPYGYLVTAATFLGYQFNPVSFWYLYDGTKSLAAMILEVNNTFDERRMYFLSPSDGTEGLLEDGGKVKQPRQTLKYAWPKDFHVSPFNSRKGSYSLTAHDPLNPFMQGIGPVSNTINLSSSKGHGKLVARLIPLGTAVDPYDMTMLQKLTFLAAWWWVGFVTFPRIVKEAGLLFFRRKLHVWFRPEPLKESMGRNADATERELELVFRRYLRHRVDQSTVSLAVKYIPGGIPADMSELMLSPIAREEEPSARVEELEFKVLTPVFYTRFVHYAHDLEALFCESQESNTIWLSRPELLPALVSKKAAAPLALPHYWDFAAFKLIQMLRARPERIERPLTSSAAPAAAPAVEDIRGFRISPMDGFVLRDEDPQTRKTYRNNVLKVFLADRLAWGSVALLGLQRFALQMGAAWVLSFSIDGLVARSLTYVGKHMAG